MGMKELSFTVLALGAAMLSNVSSAARGVLSKKTMSGKDIGENLDAQNLYAVLTAMSTLVLIPLMLAIEGTGFFSAFKSTVAAGDFTNKSLAALLGLGGASYYAYNEVAFLALGKVNPVTHAVWKYYQTRCDHRCLCCRIQDAYEHWINYRI